MFLKEEEKVVEEVKDARQLTAALKRAFGTKKAIKHMEQMEALNTDASFVDDQIKETLSGIISYN